jgi:hypothetical protein
MNSSDHLKPSAWLVNMVAVAGLAFSSLRGQALCIVGYANVPMMVGYNLAANPLDKDGVNALTNIMSAGNGVPDGTQVYVWDVTSQAFGPPAKFSAASGTWNTNFFLPPGQGFVVYTTNVWTNTYVGNVVPCPGQTNHFLVAGKNKLSLVASRIPAGGSLTNSIFQFQGHDGDQIYFLKTAQAYSDAFTYFTGYSNPDYGWYDPNGTTGGPVLAVGQSFFIQHPGADYDWAQTLSQGALSAGPAPSGASSLTAFEVGSVATKQNFLILHVDSRGSGYDVQFSADGLAWKTAATEQTSRVWTGQVPAGPFGYIRAMPSRSRRTSP